MSRGRLKFGDFALNVADRRLARDGRELPLAPKAFDLLVHFEEVLAAVWPDGIVEEGILSVQESALTYMRRTAIPADGFRPQSSEMDELGYVPGPELGRRCSRAASRRAWPSCG